MLGLDPRTARTWAEGHDEDKIVVALKAGGEDLPIGNGVYLSASAAVYAAVGVDVRAGRRLIEVIDDLGISWKAIAEAAISFQLEEWRRKLEWRHSCMGWVTETPVRASLGDLLPKGYDLAEARSILRKTGYLPKVASEKATTSRAVTQEVVVVAEEEEVACDDTPLAVNPFAGLTLK